VRRVVFCSLALHAWSDGPIGDENCKERAARAAHLQEWTRVARGGVDETHGAGRRHRDPGLLRGSGATHPDPIPAAIGCRRIESIAIGGAQKGRRIEQGSAPYHPRDGAFVFEGR
jgi:hypothetical protein